MLDYRKSIDNSLEQIQSLYSRQQSHVKLSYNLPLATKPCFAECIFVGSIANGLLRISEMIHMLLVFILFVHER
jgi:hypothetical protein